MDMNIKLGDEDYKILFEKAHDIAIPVSFDDEQLSAFGAPSAKRETYKAGDFTGNVAQGGSCNCETYTITPHCNGTHTESVGHITAQPAYVSDILPHALMPAILHTVMPQTARECGEHYNESLHDDDLVITQQGLQELVLEKHITALVVRTLPNDDEKKSRDYGAFMPPYFTMEAMEYIATSGVQHLLVDLPSVDRLDDGGALLNHRIFWGVDMGETEAPFSAKTITELVYVPDEVIDGLYLLNLQVAAFKADAAPSRPVLYEIEKYE